MPKPIRIGTRESQLAQWQARQVKNLLAELGFSSELVLIKSGGDIDLQTPLYEMGVQGIFTKELDIALIHKQVDMAVHSFKDVPTQLAKGIEVAAVLERGPVEDLLVFKNEEAAGKYKSISNNPSSFTVATSSIRRKAQWLHRYPGHIIENLRGNVNTRLRKLSEENWDAAIFARAGLERIDLRPANSIVLEWMLPAPAQGAMVIVCREDDKHCLDACRQLNHEETFLCTQVERDFLRKLLGGCSTPISALALIDKDKVSFKGSLLSLDGKQKVEVEAVEIINNASKLGTRAALELLDKGGRTILENTKNAKS